MIINNKDFTIIAHFQRVCVRICLSYFLHMLLHSCIRKHTFILYCTFYFAYSTLHIATSAVYVTLLHRSALNFRNEKYSYRKLPVPRCDS